MERIEREPTELTLEKSLYRIEQAQMLQFTDSGFSLIEYVKKGKTRSHSYRLGGTVHEVTLPVLEPTPGRSASSIDELFDTPPADYSSLYAKDIVAYSIDTDEFKAWVESLVSPEQVKIAALAELDRRGVEGDEETIRCRCEHFDETGCMRCGGNGHIAKYPYIILHSEVTGELQPIKLDLATLIANEDIEVEWAGFEHQEQDNYQSSEKILRFKLSNWVDRSIAAMGVDKQNAIKVGDDGNFAAIGTEHLDVDGSRAFWHKYKDKKDNEHLSIRFVDSKEDMSATDVLNNAQAKLAYRRAWPYGKIKNEEGMVVADEWVMRPIKPLQEAIEDFKASLAESGYTLGYTVSGIATGEVGPSFYLLDEDGGILLQLSVDYGIRESLENARTHFLKIKDRLPGVK